MVLIDNQGYFELSRNGNKIVQTPQIDQLSRESVNFTNFYAAPFCSPSRTALLTGRYALRSGVHNTVGGVSILHKDEITITELLKQEGYDTSIFGKWHLGSSYPYAPEFRGFDEVFVHGGGGVSQLGDYYGNDHIDATYLHNGNYEASKGFSTDILFDQAIEFMDSKKEDSNPFFCYITTPAVHFPTNRHPVTTQRLLDRGIEDSKYLPLYSMIENVDDNIGKLLYFLENSKLKENTLLIVASDQGVNDRGAEEHRSGAFQNRGLSFDEKHHVYCMIQFPKWTEKNAGDHDNLTGMVDLMPTILDACDINIPNNIDGKSLRPILEGSNDWNQDRNLIVQCPRSRNREKWKNSSIKQGTWRLVDGKELYNIENDFGQKNNVANQHPEKVKELTQVYESFWNSLAPEESLLSEHILGAPEAPEVRLVAMDWYEGDAPWTQQGLVHRKSQGIWRVNIARDGKYQFELRHYPREKIMAIEAVKATVQVGDVSQDLSIPIEANEAKITMELKKGTYDLKTIFSSSSNTNELNEWGANFVHVSYLN
jgi:arylsulfatase A-like enzyme